MAPDWTWLPPEDEAPATPLTTSAPEPDLVDWAALLGPAAPDELATPSEAPPVGPGPAQPVEAAPPSLDPLTGTERSLADLARFPWETADGPGQPAPAQPAQPAPFEIDALTGGTPEPVADPLADPVIPQQADASYDPAEAEAMADERRLAALSPVEFAAEKAARDERWAQRRTELLDEALLEDKRARRENAEIADKAHADAREEMAEIREQAAELAQAEVDPGRWFAEASTSQKVGATIAALIGGFMSPNQGGRNRGIEFIMQLIDQDIAAQRENLRGRRDALTMRRGLVGDLVDLGMSEHRAAEVTRQAAFQAIDLELAQAEEKFEQGGTARLRIEGARREAEQAELARQQAVEDRDRKIKWEEQKQKRADDTLAFQRSSHFARLKADEAHREWQRDQAEDKRRAAEQAAEGAGAAKLREDVEKRGIGGLVQEDGRPFLVGSTEERDKLATKLGKVQSATTIINRLLRAREKHGWTPGLFNSEEFQEARSDWGALNFGAKDIEELGVIAGADLELIENFLGAAGPGVRDPSAGLRRARDNWTKGLNDQLRARNYTGPDWSPAMTLHDKQERTDYLDQIAREQYGATQGDLAAEYERIVEDSAAAGVAPESIAEFKARKAREHKALEQSLRDQAKRSREADRASDLYDDRSRQRR